MTRGRRGGRARIGIGQVLFELDRTAGPLPVDQVRGHLVDVGGGRGRAAAVELFEHAVAALAAGDVAGADRLRWAAIAALRAQAWFGAVFRCGPVGGPYSFHRLGEAWPSSDPDECC